MFDINVRLNKDMEVAKAKMQKRWPTPSFEVMVKDIQEGYSNHPFNFKEFSFNCGLIYEFDANDCRALWNWLDLPNSIPVAA